MSQYGFYFNGPRCTGCKTCMLACKDNKDLSADMAFRQIYEYGGGEWTQGENKLWTTDAYAYYLSAACNHCDEPACVAICPQASMVKDEETGLVHNDPETCIGCGSCATACPYGAPKVDEEAKISKKCDGCFDRVKAGETPICVQSCPLRALEFDEIETLRSTYGDVADIAPLPDPSQTHPNVVITAPSQAKESGDTSGAVLNEVELV